MKRAVRIAKRIHSRIYDDCRIVPVDLQPLLRAIGLPVEYVNFKVVDEYLYRNRETGVQFLAVNARMPRARRRFSTAHGIGHYLLHPDMKGAFSVGTQKSYADWEADAFAEELLMPEHRFRTFFESFYITGIGFTGLVNYLGLVFDVSRQAISVRIDHLDLLTDKKWREK